MTMSKILVTSQETKAETLVFQTYLEKCDPGKY